MTGTSTAPAYLEITNDAASSLDGWPEFNSPYDILAIGRNDGDYDDDVHGWRDMMDADDEDMDWLNQNPVIDEDNDKRNDFGDCIANDELYPSKKGAKRTSLDGTETWLSEEDDACCLDMDMADDNDEDEYNVVCDLRIVPSSTNVEHVIVEEMILTDLALKEWHDDDCAATVLLETQETDERKLIAGNVELKPPVLPLVSSSIAIAASTSFNTMSSSSKSPLVTQQWNDIPSTITATFNESNFQDYDVDDDNNSVDDAIMTMILEGGDTADDCSVNAFLQQQQQKAQSPSLSSPRRPSIASHCSVAATVATSASSNGSGVEGASLSSTKSFHDLFEERRAQLAASMEASRRSRTRCFLKSHVKTRASLANVLRDIERSSRVVAKNIVRYWEEQNRIQHEREMQELNLHEGDKQVLPEQLLPFEKVVSHEARLLVANKENTFAGTAISESNKIDALHTSASQPFVVVSNKVASADERIVSNCTSLAPHDTSKIEQCEKALDSK